MHFLSQKPIVTYIAYEPYGKNFLVRFIEKYKKYQSGYDHDLVICFKQFKNTNGTLRFDLFEYGDVKASTIGIKSGVISIKTSEGKKIKATAVNSVENGSLAFFGLKEKNVIDLNDVKNMIKIMGTLEDFE